MDAHITNGYVKLCLHDLYAEPELKDLNDLSADDSESGKKTIKTISSDSSLNIDKAPFREIIVADEKNGKTTFLKQMFVRLYQKRLRTYLCKRK